jgi:sulfite reductase alpha subunit-like flavoprotein
MIIFFACRNLDENIIYRDELEEMQKTPGDKLRKITAFSR